MPSTRSKRDALVAPLPLTTKRKRSESVATSVEEATTTTQQIVVAEPEPEDDYESAPKRRKTRAASRATSVETTTTTQDAMTAPKPAAKPSSKGKGKGKARATSVDTTTSVQVATTTARKPAAKPQKSTGKGKKRAVSVETDATGHDAVATTEQPDEPAPKRKMDSKKSAKAAAPAPAPTRRTTRATSQLSDMSEAAPAPMRRTTRATSQMSDMSDSVPVASTSRMQPAYPAIEESEAEHEPESSQERDQADEQLQEEEEEAEHGRLRQRHHEPGMYPWQPWKPENARDHLFQQDLKRRMEEAQAQRESAEAEAREEAERQEEARRKQAEEDNAASNQARSPVQNHDQPPTSHSAMGNHTPHNQHQHSAVGHHNPNIHHSAMGNHTPHTAQQTAQPQATPKTGFLSRLWGVFTPGRGGQTPAPQPQQALPTQQCTCPQCQPRLHPASASQVWSAQQSQMTDTPAGSTSYEPEQSQEQTTTSTSAQQSTSQSQDMQMSITDADEMSVDESMDRPTIKRKRSAYEETGLDAISESPETSAVFSATPSRTQGSLTNGGYVPRADPRPTPAVTPRHRSVNRMRAERAAKERAATPSFKRFTPVAPHDPNADRRIQRVREIEHLRAQQRQNEEALARLEAEQQADAPRKTKRVKVDQLKEIPHNRPGEGSGSFRVPDWDSDDEMEVDEDAELIDNPFAAAAEEEKEAEHVKAPEPVKEKMKQPVKELVKEPVKTAQPVKEQQHVIEAPKAPTPELIADNSGDSDSDLELEWPELPPREEGLGAVLADTEEAGKRFELGFEQFLRTGEVLAAF